ncbi:alpha/beta fold hydrolase [Mycolicibacterium sp. P1-5]|uniref:alpha/beta fold hydrolase n=1 Tax=Mycolicibacterium sp. P1-5 TaxID=2024617 RepID=UPI0011EFB173|nr:alpha/beta hydrolase [Mycolicibacterium sp. P1-5]KAA0108610.1 alpha/beta hydrolase [Mycolicibacterium sp. P1-5]
MLPASVRQWQEGGRMLSTSAGNVFVRSQPGTQPTVLLLHGFPSSSYDFRGVVDRLGDRAWLTLDFLGFGLSDKPRPHRYSLLEQADIVAQVVADVAPGPVVLLAHDMGTSVATELLARDVSGSLPFEIQRAVLTNGSVILERASLRPSQKILRGPLGPLLARLTNERGFLRGFAKLFSAAHPLSDDEAKAQWALMARDDGHRIINLLCAYLNERVRFAERWHGAVRDWDKPLGFLWATGDPVATTNVLAGLRELRPAAEVIELTGIGHYPQIEVPDEFTAGARQLLRLA